jgi:alkyldihydroxyacetonephosphate synthase
MTESHAPEMHWSRWGDPAKAHPLDEAARGLVETFIGTIEERSAVALEDVVVPQVGLSQDLLDGLAGLVGAEHVHTDPETRIRHTRGKSTPDLLKMRQGDASDAPDAVVRPAGHDEVDAIVRYCSDHGIALVPFGGGTSVVGGLAARRDGFAGVIALDLVRMKRLVRVDRESMTATLEAGMLGPEAEALLGEHGLTIGHHPQSFEYASIGGFAVTRSSGQASSGYGRFDSLVVGLRVATPLGDWELGSAPANAAGPDLRELVMGSEGAFGVVTEVTVRVRAVPAVKVYETWRFGSFEEGAAAMRTLKQGGIEPTVLRLSDEMETMVNLADPSAIGAEGSGGCLMVTGFEGTQETVDRKRALVSAAVSDLGGTNLGLDESWADGRYDGPYVRDSMLDLGVLVETLETATFWSNVPTLYESVRTALSESLGQAIILCHISHVYENGCSLYFTVAAKQEGDGLDQWMAAKTAASDAIISTGSTITHHHAIGTDHKPWLVKEIGPVGVDVLRAVKERLDPAGVLNPGILIP